jgi:hypothetical protein
MTAQLTKVFQRDEFALLIDQLEEIIEQSGTVPAMTASHLIPANLELMPESEVAYYLRKRLGTMRVWPFQITGQRRNNCRGLDLPFAFKLGRQYYYAVKDVDDFAAAMEILYPDEAKSGEPVKVMKASDVLRERTASKVRPDLAKLTATPPTLH